VGPREWGGTTLTPFQIFLVLHLAFGRGANNGDKITWAFTMSSWCTPTKKARKTARRGPLSGEASGPSQQKLDITSGGAAISRTVKHRELALGED
jgi:hypothetical protein